jgi:acetyl coenzyme A synthetase (ADP forming)-like protein
MDDHQGIPSPSKERYVATQTIPANPQPCSAVEEADVVLRDGSTVRLRLVRDDDREGVAALYGGMSDQSRYYRFLTPASVTPQTVAWTVESMHAGKLSIVAERAGQILGVASWVREPREPTTAEVAFVVAEDFHGHGLGTRMLERLAELARPLGITRFLAWVLAENHLMLRVFKDSGFRVLDSSIEHGVSHLALDLQETETFLAQAAARAEVAATASVRPFFKPRTVAVVGASRTRGKIGAEVFQNIRAGGFTGTVIPVNPKAAEIDGVPAVARVSAIETPVDLAVIAVPWKQVARVVDDCLAKHVPALMVLSAGFGEAGEVGRGEERALVAEIRRAGVRLIGPNCMGLINTEPAVRLNASFAGRMPPPGRVAFASQSGALGLAVLDYVHRLGLGISTFVSVGNKADVSGNDLIQYWADDPRTDVILMYLESFGNPQRFSRIARRVARRKPIVAVKAGRSGAGARAASSHTGALATDDRVVEALFEQSGVIRTHTLEELFDVANLLVRQPLPRGRRVGILTNAGGPGILAADACEAEGLEVPALSSDTAAALKSDVPAAASVGNPVDLLATASPEDYGRALPLLLRDESIDSVIVIHVPLLGIDSARVAGSILEASSMAHGKPVLATFLEADGAARLPDLPTFAFPESGARALARVTRYAEWLARPQGEVVSFSDLDEAAVRGVVDWALGRGEEWLRPEEVSELLRAAGIPTVPSGLARSEQEAVARAESLGFPVAVKAVGPTIVHKTEVGGVRLGLTDSPSVAASWREMHERLGSALEAVQVQRMAPAAPEMLVGTVQHATFGPLIACGGGGVQAELLQDVVYRLHPLTERDAREMLDEVRSTRLLRGYRGAPLADEEAVREALLRVSALLEACPEIQELDLNPVRVLPRGILVLDARVRVARIAPHAPSRRVWY